MTRSNGLAAKDTDMLHDYHEDELDQTRAPFFEALLETRERGPLSFHMPGHKFNPELLPELTEFFGEGVVTGDLNECLPPIDYLHAATETLLEAQALAAMAVGADRTFFLVNGSTVGNQAMLLTVAHDGQKVIVPRAAHRSVYAGLILSGVTPIYVAPRHHPQVGVPLAVEVSAVQQKLAEHPDAVAVHITNPNYYGYLSDVAGVIELAHARGVPLLVDEAHGAHLPYHPDLPRSAVSLGADLVVQSAHKTLGALTQAAWLHFNGARVSVTKLQQFLALLQSSSPSVLLTGSLDVARRQMVLQGRLLLERALRLAARAREGIRQIPGLWCYGDELIGEYGIAAHDPTKLVVRVGECGLSGTEFAAELWTRYAVGVEFADPAHLICSITIADTGAKIDALLKALRDIAQKHFGPAPTDRLEFTPPPLPQLALNPRQAAFAPTETIAWQAAAGRVCAEQIMPYPPGIPLVMPGEVIEVEMIEYVQYLLSKRVKIVGPADLQLNTVRVMV